MTLDVAIASALSAGADLHAVAYVDLESGIVLSASIRDGARSALEVAAQAAAQICTSPPLECGGPTGIAGAAILETFVVSQSFVHVFSLSRRHPACALVGVARGGSNLALLLAVLRSLVSRIDQES